MIKVIRIKNPLLPAEDREIQQLEHKGYSLLGILGMQELPVAEIEPRKLPVVSLNGRRIPAKQWAETWPVDGDTIVVSPYVAGGSVLRTIASLAVVAASITVGALTAGAGFTMLGMTSALTATVLAGAVSVAGNLLISALSSGPSSKQSTPSYAFDGPQSLARSGSVIPKGYGSFQWGGNIIASFIDIEGADQYLNCLVCFGFGPARSITGIQINGKDIGTYQNVQYYTRLGSNNQLPIPNFNRVVNGYPQETQCLAGEPVVVPGTGTLTQIIQVDVSFPDGLFVLTNDGNYIPLSITYQVFYSLAGLNEWQPVLQPLDTQDIVTYNTLTGVANSYPTWCAVATDLPPDSGVVYATDNGPHSPGDPWSGTQTVTTQSAEGATSSYTKTFRGEWQLTDPTLNQVQVNSWTDGYVNFSGCSTQTLYNRTSIYGLAANKYDIQVIKYGSNRTGDGIGFGDNNDPRVGQQLWLHSVNEISLLDLAYPNMVLIGVRALATNQLAGSNINITALVQHGLRTLDNNILPSALQAYEEDNPACVAADMMLDALYGGGAWPGITPANLNRFIDEWVAWAELNDQLVDDGNGGSIRRHVFNGVFDNESNLWDQLSAVGMMSRAQLIPIGRDYGVFIDQADDPVQMFTMGNIVTDSFTETWLDIDARANQVEIQFADSTRFYKQDNPLVYMDPANQDAGVIIKNVRVDGKGITIPAQAWHLARNKERNNQFLLRTGTFKCDMDAIASRPGNVIILQHDVPQWGWGGRTLPGSTASALLLDRNDIPFVTGTAYSIVILHPKVLRYSGTITAAAVQTDSTGAVTGTQLTVSSFDAGYRITRCLITNGSGQSFDNPVLSGTPGFVVIQPIAGFTPAAGMTYQLFDTDVMDTRSVTGISAGGGANPPAGAVMLSTPLSVAPQDYSTYFYGQTGTQKLARIVSIRKQGDFRAQIDWIDYNASVYTDATPIIGETSALIVTNPGVTSLTAAETSVKVNGTYVTSATLSWINGPNTVGVGIYMTYAGATTNAQLVARLTNQPTSYTFQPILGVQQTFTVVGFDVDNHYAAFKTAPSISLTAQGVTGNLLLGSSFQTGFTYWNITPRVQSGSTQDTFLPDLANDGEAVYTVAGAALTVPQSLANQTVQLTADWAVGDSVMLSAYFKDSALSSSAPNSGQITATVIFINASNATIGSAVAAATLSGVTPTLTRVNTAATVIPAGTVAIRVLIGVQDVPAGASLNLPAGSTLTMSHLLLQLAGVAQTTPSAWADTDASGSIVDLFTSGSSTGLRVQGSVVPAFTGLLNFTATPDTIVISWTNLVILWPDGALTVVQDGSMTITSLANSTLYFAFLFFDIVNGGVKFATPTTPQGSPGILALAYDALADASSRADGRVALAAGGLQVTTQAAGATTPTSGSGGGGTATGGDGGGPISYPTV